MLRHIMGVAGVILAAWGVGFLYTAATASDAAWYDQGVAGAACLVGAMVIYRRWFSS